MYIRNYKGKLVEFHPDRYHSETLLYQALWKIRFNITLGSPESVTARDLAAFAVSGIFG
jgi:hypothetical protein